MISTSLNYYEVPNYESHVFSEKQHDYCVIIFVINEGEKLHKQLERMSHVSLNADIIIADGDSSDGSTDHSLLKSLNVNTLLIKKQEGKLGTQMRIGFSWALERGYKGVVVIDGNNKDSVTDIPHFVEKLELNYDHVQGSRFIPGGHAINTPKSRLLGLKVLHVPVMRLASGFKYTDTTNGFRAYSRKLLLDNDISVFRDIFTGYELHYYLAIEAAKRKFKCLEIPVTREYPKSGKTPTKISPIKGNLQVIEKLFACALSKYRVK
ncbi:glycosyltransferase family 2 protein [Photobacterium nomapromontoriensis]|uniref:glycosyltransferase family 2 protein n=1 Tax=Photobacterium nomapromontoriensis TaxID=2910237 RepID=UPI003D0D5247